MTFLLLLLVLVAIATLAPKYGVDTRDGLDWQPHDVGPDPVPQHH